MLRRGPGVFPVHPRPSGTQAVQGWTPETQPGDSFGAAIACGRPGKSARSAPESPSGWRARTLGRPSCRACITARQRGERPDRRVQDCRAGSGAPSLRHRTAEPRATVIAWKTGRRSCTTEANRSPLAKRGTEPPGHRCAPSGPQAVRPWPSPPLPGDQVRAQHAPQPWQAAVSGSPGRGSTGRSRTGNDAGAVPGMAAAAQNCGRLPAFDGPWRRQRGAARDSRKPRLRNVAGCGPELRRPAAGPRLRMPRGNAGRWRRAMPATGPAEVRRCLPPPRPGCGGRPRPGQGPPARQARRRPALRHSPARGSAPRRQAPRRWHCRG